MTATAAAVNDLLTVTWSVPPTSSGAPLDEIELLVDGSPVECAPQAEGQVSVRVHYAATVAWELTPFYGGVSEPFYGDTGTVQTAPPVTAPTVTQPTVDPAAPSIADVDLTAIAANWIAGHPKVLAEFASYGASGGDDALGDSRVLGVVRPPYPMIRVLPVTGGSDRDLRWIVQQAVQVEGWGDMDGAPGPAALRRLVLLALTALRELPDRDYGPGEAVVTDVSSLTGAYELDDPSGQPRWLGVVLLTGHPANVAA